MKRRDILLSSASIATAAVVANSQLSAAKQPDTTIAVSRSEPRVGKTIQIAKGLPGYYVTPTGTGKFPAVIVLMEAFGLNNWCKSICNRLAQVSISSRGNLKSMPTELA